MDAMVMADDEIKVLHGALDEREDGEIILRGVIDPSCLQYLRTDDYQREVLRPVATTRGKPSPIKIAVVKGVTLPDVELGMRGLRCDSRGGTYTLKDPVYIIDGLQRISTIRGYNELNPEAPSKTQVGAVIHFGTTKEYEKERFLALNTSRSPMSPNVILRNAREDHSSILTLHGLCNNDKDFPLYGRVSWQQNAMRGQLLSALILARTALALHKHIPSATTKAGKIPAVAGPGSSNVITISMALDNMAKTLGLRHFRDNVKTFFDVVDEVFGLRVIEYRELAVQTKGNFLITLASVMSAHNNFWDDAGTVLTVDADMKRRLKNFPLHDPAIERMAGGGGSVLPLLFNMMVDHLNKGRSRNRLQERK